MARPTTTVGSARAVLIRASSVRRPRNAVQPSHTPSGMPAAQATRVASRATLRDSAAIPAISAACPFTALEVEVPAQAGGQREVVRRLRLFVADRVQHRRRDRVAGVVLGIEVAERPLVADGVVARLELQAQVAR